MSAQRGAASPHSVIACIKTPEQIEDAAGAMGKTIEREDYFAIRNALQVN